MLSRLKTKNLFKKILLKCYRQGFATTTYKITRSQRPIRTTDIIIDGKKWFIYAYNNFVGCYGWERPKKGRLVPVDKFLEKIKPL